MELPVMALLIEHRPDHPWAKAGWFPSIFAATDWALTHGMRCFRVAWIVSEANREWDELYYSEANIVGETWETRRWED